MGTGSSGARLQPGNNVQALWKRMETLNHNVICVIIIILIITIIIAWPGTFICGVNHIIGSTVAADLGQQKGSLGQNKEALSTVTGIVDGTGTLGAAIGQVINYIIFGSEFHISLQFSIQHFIGILRFHAPFFS